MASLLAHGIRLPLVLSHASVDGLDNVRADRCLEDIGQGSGLRRGRTIGAVDGDSRSAGHFVVAGDVLGVSRMKDVEGEFMSTLFPRSCVV